MDDVLAHFFYCEKNKVIQMMAHFQGIKLSGKVAVRKKVPKKCVFV